MKGGETYVGYLGIWCLCFSSYHGLLEVVCSFQAFVAQWSSRPVPALLALLRAQTIEELIFDVDVPWASVGHRGVGVGTRATCIL